MAPSKDTSVEVQLAVLQLKYNVMEEKYNEKLKDLEEKIEKLEGQSKRISEMAARWKGGGAVLIVLGSFIGFFFSYYDKVKAFLPKLGG
jgi:hypothetical protein